MISHTRQTWPSRSVKSAAMSNCTMRRCRLVKNTMHRSLVCAGCRRDSDQWNRDARSSLRMRHSRVLLGDLAMKALIVALTVAAIALLAASSVAEAKGCLKGAVVGGVAGH